MFDRFVEQHDPSRGKHRPGEQQPSALTRRDRLRATDQHRRQPLGQAGEPAAQADPIQGLDQFVIGAVSSGGQQVVPNGGSKDMRIFSEKADSAA